MSHDEMNAEIEALRAEAQTLTAQMDAAKEQLTALQRERFDLKEQRRYFRSQLREAKAESNEERIGKINLRLEELEQQLDEKESQIDTLDQVIEDLDDQMDEISDDLDEIMEQFERAGGEAAAVEGEVVKDWDWGRHLEQTMDQLNNLLQRGFKKAADTLESIDFEKVGENVQSAAFKAAKTVSGVASDAAKSVETAWNDAKEKNAQPGGVGDFRGSGSSVIDGGCYNRINVSGACKVSSDLVCRELRCSGSFKALGGVDCNGSVHVSGAFHCEKDLIAGRFSGSGSAKVLGSMSCGAFTSSGGLQVGKNLKGTEIRSSGGLRVGGDVEADSFSSTGCIHVDGMINAEQVHIRLWDKCSAGSIGGSKVLVTRDPATGFLSGILRNSFGGLTCDSIEGDEVDLTAVKAQVVRGADVVIRIGCDIDQVEYTGTCTIEDSARVGNCVKV